MTDLFIALAYAFALIYLFKIPKPKRNTEDLS
jgi:hypothetical protein